MDYETRTGKRKDKIGGSEYSMDIIFEFLGEFLLEGTIEVSKSKKVSKWIRYPLIALIVLFFTLVIVGIFALGIIALKENLLLSVILILLSLFMVVAGILKFRKTYIDKKVECKKEK